MIPDFKRLFPVCFAILLATSLTTLAQNKIMLRSGELKPTPGMDASILDQAQRASGDAIYVLMQFEKTPDTRVRENLKAEGVVLERYVPYNTWVAKIPSQDPTALFQNRNLNIRWMGSWEGATKISPRILEGQFPEYSKHETGRVQIMMLLNRDTDLTIGAQIAEEHDGIVAGHLTAPKALTVWIMPENIGALAAENAALYITESSPPLDEQNDDARRTLNVTQVQEAPYNLDGSGVNVLVFDGGRADTHPAFGGRLNFVSGDTAGTSQHATHVAGTVGGDGIGGNPPPGRDLKGMAYNATIWSAGYSQIGGTVFFWENAGDLETDYTSARNNHGIDMATNSIGANLAQNNFDCNLEGDYGLTAEVIDNLIRGDVPAIADPIIVTWAAGNERSGGTPSGRCGSGYGTLPPPASAKNSILVAATNSDGDSMTTFSSWGPTDDGRLRPTISGPGCESGVVSGESSINSTLLSGTYGGLCGTSMATPAVAGVTALSIEHYRDVTGDPTARPLPALVKAWFIHTARDLEVAGPDYIFGYGEVDAKATIDLITEEENYLTGEISATREDDSYAFQVPASANQLKVSLAWDDAAAAAFATMALVNDLDLELESPSGATYFPFSLDPSQPQNPATATGPNTLDNQEQVIVNNPEAGTWTIHVRGTTVPEPGQSYALVFTHANLPDSCTEIISNGDFENGLADWVTTTGTIVPDPEGLSGNVLLLGNVLTATHEAFQDVTIPAEAERVILSLDWRQTTTEVGTPQGESFTFRIRDTSDNNLDLPILHTEVWPTGQWFTSHVDMTKWAGQTVRLFLRGSNNGVNPTSWFVDNITLQSCVTDGASADLAVSVTMDTAQPVAAGEDVVYTITATNNGPDAADNIIVNMDLADNFTVQSNTCGMTNQSPFVWNVGSLNASESATCEVTVQTNAGANCHEEVMAAITGDVLDDNASNDTFTGATVTITGQLNANLPEWPTVSILELLPLLDCQPPITLKTGLSASLEP